MSRILTLTLLTLLLPAVAAAQDTVELTDTQRGYNEKGVAAIRDKNFGLAISSFESSLNIAGGPKANVIYLNLGRAYQHNGDCLKAKQNYAQVADAPAVAAPTRDEILGVMAKYSAELPELCPATVKIVCDDPQTTISLDGGAPTPCGAAVELEATPGEHELVATLGEQRVDKPVSAAEGELVEVAISFPTAQTTEPEPDIVEERPVSRPNPGLVQEAPPKSSPLRTIGLVTGAVGAAALTTGLLLEVTYVKQAVRPCTDLRQEGDRPCADTEAINKAESAQLVNKVVYAVGGGLAVGGLILYFVGGSSDGAVGLQFNNGPGISWTNHF